MYLPELFHQVNDRLCFVFGYLSNGLLLWLMVYHTDNEMKPFRPILLLSTIINLASLAVFALVVPVMPLDKGVGSLMSLGPLGWVPQPYNFALVATWHFFFHLSQYSLPVPFLYRYLNLVRNWNWNWYRYVAMILVAIVLTLVSQVLLYFACYSHTELDSQLGISYYFGNDSSLLTSYVHMDIGGNKTYHRYVMSCFTHDHEHAMLLMSYVMPCILISNVLVFFFGWRIYRHLRRKLAENLNAERTRDLNRQVSLALLLQALVPLLIDFAPMMELAISVVTGMELGQASVYETAIFAWVPVINPLVPMWVIHAYRKQLHHWSIHLRQKLGLRSQIAPATTALATPGGGGPRQLGAVSSKSNNNVIEIRQEAGGMEEPKEPSQQHPLQQPQE